ncbi:MAG: DUF4276 family protein [Kofleriaceae bacterium]
MGLIVEGHGEVEAMPVLLRRVAAALGVAVQATRPFRVPRHQLIKEAELQRTVEAVARRVGTDGPILIVLDADDDCIRDRAASMLDQARATRRDRELAVVLPNREFEAWFLASIESLRGRARVRPDACWPGEAESVRDAKGALQSLMAGTYSPTVDQPALAALMDLELARQRSRSFDKLWRDLARLLGAADRR